MWTLVLSAESVLAVPGAPITTSPLFELIVILQKNYIPMSGPIEIIAEEERSHESTLAEFLPLVESSTASQTLMRTMLSAHTEADDDVFSRTHLGPTIMHYAEAQASRARTRTRSLTKLTVLAIVDYVTLDLERTDLDALSYVDIQYQLIPAAPVHHLSCLSFVEWANGDEDDQCSVCFGDFVSGEKLPHLSCDHVFHMQCIFKWLFRHGTCPICRDTCTIRLDTM